MVESLHTGDQQAAAAPPEPITSQYSDHVTCLDQSEARLHLGARHGEDRVVTAGAEAAQAPGVGAGVEYVKLRGGRGEGEHLRGVRGYCSNNTK